MPDPWDPSVRRRSLFGAVLHGAALTVSILFLLGAFASSVFVRDLDQPDLLDPDAGSAVAIFAMLGGVFGVAAITTQRLQGRSALLGGTCVVIAMSLIATVASL